MPLKTNHNPGRPEPARSPAPQAAIPPGGKAHARRTRPWPVSAISFLLLLQTLGLFASALYFLSPLRPTWPVPAEALATNARLVLSGLALGLLGLACLLATAGFFRLWLSAWHHAVTIQGFMLLVALILYLGSKPPLAYLLMAYGVLMVLYLHQRDVVATFRPEPEPNSRESEQ